MDQDAQDDLRARLLQLAEEVGDPAVVGEAVRLFLSNLPGLLDRVTDGDGPLVRHEAAHRLAGSAETLGATTLGACCRNVMMTQERDATSVTQVRVAANDVAQVMQQMLATFDSS